LSLGVLRRYRSVRVELDPDCQSSFRTRRDLALENDANQDAAKGLAERLGASLDVVLKAGGFAL
jgi:hypothetical protein